MKIKLQTKKYWDIMSKTDIEPIFPGRNRMIQGMKELLQIIKPHIKKKDLFGMEHKTTLEKLFPAFMTLFMDSLRSPVISFDIGFNIHYHV